jgi:hypothetical protein
MPLSTIFFDEFFDSVGDLDNYDPDVRQPFPDVSDHQLLVLPNQADGPTPGEGYGRFVAPTYNCPNCAPGVCGTPDASCYFGASFARPFQNAGGIGDGSWRHYRFLIRPHGSWDDDNDFPTVAGILFNQPGCVVGGYYYWPEYSMYVGPDGVCGFGHWGASIDLPAGTIPFDEWTCVEMAAMAETSRTGKARAWINEALVFDADYDSGVLCDGLGGPHGFVAGSWSGGLAGAGKHIDFARLAWADGPISCARRGAPLETGAPDPDAERCTWDEYDTQCVVSGDCGRVQFQPNGLGREADGWETFGNGFPSSESGWFSWTCPRTGKYIWRTRGSTLFNEIGVYRHTGDLPPPLVKFADDDEWDPGTPFSSAVEIEAEAGVEYRIRVATSFSERTDWIVVSWGPAKTLVQDDAPTAFFALEAAAGETGLRSTLTLEGGNSASGAVIRDAQHAAVDGSGAEPSLRGIVFGAD